MALETGRSVGGEVLTGVLVLVGTPIGNLGDLAPRAVDALKGADVVACEDTRRTRKLLTHADIHPPSLIVVADHNEAAQTRLVLRLLDEGKRVAVVTDAGMPGISDPGERLVRGAAAAGHRVEVVPGPSAVVSALVVSGLATGRFSFEGFLPRKGRERSDRLAEVAADARTTVIFESPHRVVDTLRDLAAVCGPARAVAVVRELTKLHEEVWRGSLTGAIAHATEAGPRGEYVIVLGGAPPAGEPTDDDLTAALTAALEAGADNRTAIAQVTAEFRVPRRRVYKLALALKDR